MSHGFLEKIAGHLARERREGSVPTRRGDPITSVEAITTEWLTHVLCTDVPGAEVTGLRIEPVSFGTHDRHRLHVTYNSAAEAADLPATLFTKTLSSVERRAMAGPIAARESYFYNELRPLLEIEAPVAYASTVDPEGYATIHLLEDLTASKGVTFADYQTYVSREMAEDMVGLLANLHGTFLDDPSFHEHAEVLPMFDLYFPAFAKVFDSATYTAIALRDSGDRVPKGVLDRIGEVWPATLRSLDIHSNGPKTIIHSDVHIGNWYVTGDGRMGLTDWQLMCIGHHARDLAYAVSTALLPEDRRNWEEELVRLYADTLSAGSGRDVGFDETWRLYRQQMLLALAMWTITLRHPDHIPDMQPDEMSFAMIERTATAIDDLGSLDLCG